MDDRQRRDRERLTARAMQAYLLYVLMPLWTIPGFGDYLCHRRAKIESTSGTQESITHSLMMARSQFLHFRPCYSRLTR
jgi:hypothetical protein